MFSTKVDDRLTIIVTKSNLSQGTSGGVTVSKLDKQTYTSEFESHWAPHSFGFVPHRSKELCKLLKVTWVLFGLVFIAYQPV